MRCVHSDDVLEHSRVVAQRLLHRELGNVGGQVGVVRTKGQTLPIEPMFGAEYKAAIALSHFCSESPVSQQHERKEKRKRREEQEEEREP